MDSLDNSDALLVEMETVFKKVFEHLKCPKCSKQLSSTHTTVCGHRFCVNCIEDIRKNSKKCTECKHVLQDDDYVRDTTFDTLISELTQLKDKKMQTMINQMLCAATNESRLNINLNSPLQQVLKDHLVKTLTVHEEYLNDVRSSFSVQIEKLKDKHKDEISRIEKSNPDVAEIAKKKKEAEQKMIKEQEKIIEEFNEQSKRIAQKYAKYLEYCEMTPKKIPVKIYVCIPSKNIEIEGPELKPSQNVKDILEWLKKALSQTPKKISSFPENLILLNFGPFCTYNSDEMMKIYQDFINNNKLPEFIEEIKITKYSDSFPIQDTVLLEGSKLAFFGDIFLENEMPKKCFKYAFKKDVNVETTYYKCITCKDQKWICKICMENCHKGHESTVFLKNHISTKALCYCSKTKCLLVED